MYHSKVTTSRAMKNRWIFANNTINLSRETSVEFITIDCTTSSKQPVKFNQLLFHSRGGHDMTGYENIVPIIITETIPVV